MITKESQRVRDYIRTGKVAPDNNLRMYRELVREVYLIEREAARLERIRLARTQGLAK